MVFKNNGVANLQVTKVIVNRIASVKIAIIGGICLRRQITCVWA